MSNHERAQDFFNRHAGEAYNLALRLCGNPADAEDLAQDALIRAVKALPDFKGGSSESTWLYRIVVNTWKNRLRSQRRRGWMSMIPLHFFRNSDEEEELPIASKEAPPDSGLAAQETRGEVWEALNALDEQDRAIIVLKDMEDKSYKEIAEVLDIPEGTVKSRLSRAREAFREAFKGKPGQNK